MEISTYALGLAALLTLSSAGAVEEHPVICDFSADSPVEWFNVDDVVMGGRSDSRLVLHEDGTASFTGRVSLENNGGFASVRGRLGRTDLSAYEGLELRVRGDGKSYGVRLRMNGRFDGLSYAADLDPPAGTWSEVRVPFALFVPTFRGRVINQADPLDPSRIEQIGLIISDKQEGTFHLELDWIAVY